MDQDALARVRSRAAGGNYFATEDEVKALTDEINRLRRGTCTFCGWQPTVNRGEEGHSEQIVDHMLTCSFHPMAALRIENERLRESLATRR